MKMLSAKVFSKMKCRCYSFLTWWKMRNESKLPRNHRRYRHVVWILHKDIHVHAKSTLRGVRVDWILLSKMRGWNALICLNMHAVELRRGDTGQNKNKHWLNAYLKGYLGACCAEKKQSSFETFIRYPCFSGCISLELLYTHICFSIP